MTWKVKLGLILALLVFVFVGWHWLFTGFTASQKIDRQHMWSKWKGHEREITWTSYSGDKKVWVTTTQVEREGGFVNFLDIHGNPVVIGPGIKIETVESINKKQK